MIIEQLTESQSGNNIRSNLRQKLLGPCLDEML